MNVLNCASDELACMNKNVFSSQANSPRLIAPLHKCYGRLFQVVSTVTWNFVHHSIALNRSNETADNVKVGKA